MSDPAVAPRPRRRPWIMIGTALFAVALTLLGRQHSFAGVAVWWALSLVGFCVLTAALTGVISDQVPVGQRATVSGWMAAPQPIGVLLGVAVLVALGLSRATGYLTVAITLLVCGIGFVLRMPDEVLPAPARPPLSVGAFVRGFWISPREHPDFGWTLAGRVLVNSANALTTTLLLYFLEFGLGMPSGPAQSLLVVVIAIYSVASVIASLLVGRLSDRAGKRKRYVIITALLQSAAGLILIIAPGRPTVIMAAILCGFGFGAFLAVDQALATQCCPPPRAGARTSGS